MHLCSEPGHCHTSLLPLPEAALPGHISSSPPAANGMVDSKQQGSPRYTSGQRCAQSLQSQHLPQSLNTQGTWHTGLPVPSAALRRAPVPEVSSPRTRHRRLCPTHPAMLSLLRKGSVDTVFLEAPLSPVCPSILSAPKPPIPSEPCQPGCARQHLFQEVLPLYEPTVAFALTRAGLCRGSQPGPNAPARAGSDSPSPGLPPAWTSTAVEGSLCQSSSGEGTGPDPCRLGMLLE